MNHGLDWNVIETVGHEDLETLDDRFFQDFEFFLFLKHDGNGFPNELGIDGLLGASGEGFLQEKNGVFG